MFRAADALLLLPLSVFMPPLVASLANSTPAPVPIPITDGFDFPVGAPDAEGYYDAQPFGKNLHLGEDWNGVGGGRTDFGDPVFSMGAGRVTFAADLGGGWGNVVRVVHAYQEDGRIREVESFYAHLHTMDVTVGEALHRGQKLGTIGDANGAYIPHLHLELRQRVGLPHGPGYSTDTRGWLSPTDFVKGHRPPI